MIALSVAKLQMFSPESEFFLSVKPKKKRKLFFVESLDQCRRLEVREKARNVFCDEPTSVYATTIVEFLFSVLLGKFLLILYSRKDSTFSQNEFMQNHNLAIAKAEAQLTVFLHYVKSWKRAENIKRPAYSLH